MMAQRTLISPALTSARSHSEAAPFFAGRELLDRLFSLAVTPTVAKAALHMACICGLLSLDPPPP
jgi:hypothetical protein